MKRFVLLDTAPIPGTTDSLCLFEYGEDFVIKIESGKGGQLMNTRMHGSEDALAEIPAGLLKSRGTASAPQRVLIGGLGMGFTLASALAHFKADAEVVVAELVPGVITWNDGPLGAKAGYPIRNPRTTVENRDVAEVLREAPAGFDAIMLDVDNGPEGLTADDNDWLYSAEGLAVCAKALRHAGILAVWSATADARFSQRLSRAGFKAEARQVYAHGTSGAKHTIWIARYIGRSATSESGSGAVKGEKKGKRTGGTFKGAGAKGRRRR